MENTEITLVKTRITGDKWIDKRHTSKWQIHKIEYTVLERKNQCKKLFHHRTEAGKNCTSTALLPQHTSHYLSRSPKHYNQCRGMSYLV
jgi:hypothetical protein